MNLMKKIGLAIILFALPLSAFAEDGCLYADQKFSVGSTRCDCPSVKIDNMHFASGERGQLTSRRLTCSKDGTWVETTSLCVDMSGADIGSEFYRLSRMYCPMALNPEEAEKTMSAASDPVAQGALKGVCNLLTVSKKLENLSEPCKVLIDAFAH